jgi:hypothetical protein
MGVVMKPAILAAALLAIAGTAAAQNDADRIFKAGSGGSVILSTVGELIVAVETCKVGDRAEWDGVVSAIDRRYRFCAAKDPAWTRLMDDFKEAEAKALAEGATRSWGSFGLETVLQHRGAEARAMGTEAFCAKLPWRLILVPGAATDEARAEHMKANPQSTLDQALRFFAYIRTLGSDAAWIEAPCDKAFWPEFK